MTNKWFRYAVLGLAMLATASVQAQILKTLYNFNGAPDGTPPSAGWFGLGTASTALLPTAAPIRLRGLCSELTSRAMKRRCTVSPVRQTDMLRAPDSSRTATVTSTAPLPTADCTASGQFLRCPRLAYRPFYITSAGTQRTAPILKRV